MKFKKSLVKVIVVGSIFFISSMSFGGLISLQDDSLNNFWTIKKLDISFVNSTYADDDEREDNEREDNEREDNEREDNEREDNEREDNEREDNEREDNEREYKSLPTPKITTKFESKISYIEPVIIEKKEIKLNNSEIEGINKTFNKVVNIIDKKYITDSKKLKIYTKLNTLLDNKISTLELIKTNIKNNNLFEKYEKQILLFTELKTLAQEKILLYINSIDLTVDENVSLKEKAINAKANILENLAAKKASETKKRTDAKIAADKIAADKIAADKIAKANAVEQGKIAREKRLAAEAKAARIAKIAADKRKAEASRIAAIKAAAQAAAAAAANTNTRAS